MDEHLLELRVVYVDLPDLIELGVRVYHGEWSAVSTLYTSASFLREDTASILQWSQTPGGPLRIETGTDTGSGWLVLEFFTVGRAGHARCAIELAPMTIGPTWNLRRWRFAIVLPTELGLVERFARECVSLGQDFKGEARLIGLPA
jgi:hypothetical protein